MTAPASSMVVAAGQGPERYHDTYAAKDTAPAKARQDVALYLSTWNLGHLAEAARTIVSELVTNAVTHTDTRRIGVSVTRTGTTAVHIVVTDCSRQPPLPDAGSRSDPVNLTEHGRGLLLVEALSTRWGTEQLATGKRIWADLDTTKDTDL